MSSVRSHLWVFVLFLFPAGGGAQELLERLAREVCDCIQAEAEIIYPRIQAMRCLGQVVEANPRSIRAGLQLRVDIETDRRRLSDLLIDPLLAECPMLAGLAPGEVEPRIRYSDVELSRQAIRGDDTRRSPKRSPPADPATTTTIELPTQRYLEATVLDRPDRDSLRIQGNTTQYTMYLPRKLRGLSFPPGQYLYLSYRTRWEESIGYEIVEIISFRKN